MNARIIILIFLAGGLAVYMAVKPKADPKQQMEEEISEQTQARRECDKLLWLRDLPGEAPEVEPELDVAISVVEGVGTNQLAFDFTEAHGFYVESLYVDFWYKPTPDTEKADSRLQMSYPFDDYIEANETKRLCLEVVNVELERVGGEMGTDENWGVELTRYGRARATNPAVLPCQNKDDNCQ